MSRSTTGPTKRSTGSRAWDFFPFTRCQPGRSRGSRPGGSSRKPRPGSAGPARSSPAWPRKICGGSGKSSRLRPLPRSHWLASRAPAATGGRRPVLLRVPHPSRSTSPPATIYSSLAGWSRARTGHPPGARPTPPCGLARCWRRWAEAPCGGGRDSAAACCSRTMPAPSRCSA